MEKMIHFLLSAILLASCGTKEQPEQEHSSELLELLAYRDAYAESIKGDQDKYGFIHSDRCDSALFSGLINAGGVSVSIHFARGSEKEWYRTPYHDCYDNEQKNLPVSRRSKSTISRDMLIGIMWSLYMQNDVDSLESMYEYGQKNKWVMGKGPYDRTYMTTNMQETLYILLGKEFKGLIKGWVDPINDYDRHVVALNIALRGHKQGYIDSDALDLIEKFSKIDPLNTLFQFVKARYSTGDQSHTIELELAHAKKYKPGMQCRRWPWEWHSKTWDGCPEDKKEKYTGGHLIFLTRLLEEAQSES